MPFHSHAIVLLTALMFFAPKSDAQQPSLRDLFEQIRVEATTKDATEQFLKIRPDDAEARKYLAVHLPPLIKEDPNERPHAWMNEVRLAGSFKVTEAIPALTKWIGLPCRTLSEEHCPKGYVGAFPSRARSCSDRRACRTNPHHRFGEGGLARALGSLPRSRYDWYTSSHRSRPCARRPRTRPSSKERNAPSAWPFVGGPRHHCACRGPYPSVLRVRFLNFGCRKRRDVFRIALRLAGGPDNALLVSRTWTKPANFRTSANQQGSASRATSASAHARDAHTRTNPVAFRHAIPGTLHGLYTTVVPAVRER